MEETKPLFTSAIMSEVMPQRFRIPPVIQYSGSSDPSEHIEAYRSWMQIQTAINAMMCRGFSITLTGSARSWYRQLKPNSIDSFAKLSKLFLTQFISGKKSRKSNTHLFTIKQCPKESLKDYIAHFNEEALQVEDYDDKMVLSTVFSGLREGKFTFSIRKNPPKTLAELVTRAYKYTNTEEFSNIRKNVQVAELTSKGKRSRYEEPSSANKKPDDHALRDRCPSRKSEEKFHSYTPLNTSTEQILLDIKGQKLLNWPVCMKADPDHQDKRKYFCFHRDHDHNTADCVDFKDELRLLSVKVICVDIPRKREQLEEKNESSQAILRKNRLKFVPSLVVHLVEEFETGPIRLIPGSLIWNSTST
ncbi:uncharacterized protein LOC131255049 [Magnolia sinica]|uniref:uncharacterized protein LOC131255049 n=1 Tax=Magnolia sinica TaxID=86752 RepID=UPI00265A869E|nr:uncharacterized protein LOC131255049 [Magnolia sinica]